MLVPPTMRPSCSTTQKIASGSRAIRSRNSFSRSTEGGLRSLMKRVTSRSSNQVAMVEASSGLGGRNRTTLPWRTGPYMADRLLVGRSLEDALEPSKPTCVTCAPNREDRGNVEHRPRACFQVGHLQLAAKVQAGSARRHRLKLQTRIITGEVDDAPRVRLGGLKGGDPVPAIELTNCAPLQPGRDLVPGNVLGAETKRALRSKRNEFRIFAIEGPIPRIGHEGEDTLG